jgi:hypothetical protein
MILRGYGRAQRIIIGGLGSSLLIAEIILLESCIAKALSVNGKVDTELMTLSAIFAFELSLESSIRPGELLLQSLFAKEIELTSTLELEEV